MLTSGKADWKSATWQCTAMLSMWCVKLFVSNCCSSQFMSAVVTLALTLICTLYLQHQARRVEDPVLRKVTCDVSRTPGLRLILHFWDHNMPVQASHKMQPMQCVQPQVASLLHSHGRAQGKSQDQMWEQCPGGLAEPRDFTTSGLLLLIQYR